MRSAPLFPIPAALLLLAGCATAGAGPGPTLAPFHTDGCSLFPDGTRAQPDLWCDCCLRHDLAYWRGGTGAERLTADATLRACIAERTGDPALARTVYLGVRAGGAGVYPTGFRWGYGWPYGRGNRSLSPAEQAQADERLREYLARNPTLRCGPPPAER